MPDREKVIKGLYLCEWTSAGRYDGYEPDYELCLKCPYRREDFEPDVCCADLMKDALELLKWQEPMPCGEKIKAGDVILDFYECGYCKNAIRKPWKYCPFCGKAVKWDEHEKC